MSEEDLKAIGRFRWQRPPSPYESFIEAENIPIIRGLGVYDVRELGLGPWQRMGGMGAYLELDGLQNRNALYVVEIPPRGALNAEKHMYEEVCYVVEGRGSTEVWRDGEPEKKQLFEWQKGSLFSPPLNSWHRLVNATSSPARLVVGTNAPPIMAMFKSRKFIFDNPFQFDDRYPNDDDYFRPAEELSIRPENGRHINLGNLIPDTLNCELPLENHRGAGHRNFAWRLSGNCFIGFVAQYPPGRYSKAHFHPGGTSVGLFARQGVPDHLAQRGGCPPLGKRQRSFGQAAGLRRVWHCQRGARQRRLVSRSFRYLQGAVAGHGLSWRLSSKSRRRSGGSDLVQSRPEKGRQLDRVSRRRSANP